tara:strand:+ start:14564 stop:15940 length:1377 start_codon:yes stop_codon:yes gene_type:complete
MGLSGVQYAINHNFTNNDPLLVYYDFSSGTGTSLAFTEDVDAVINNQDPSINTGAFSGIIINSRAGSEAASKTYATGEFLTSNKARLSTSNIKVPTSTLNYNSLTAIFDFEFDTAHPVTGGVLFGALEKTSQTINGEVITGAKGYNFGINDRGKLYYQGFDRHGDFMHMASDIELSKRNLISFSLDSNILEMTRVDYLNQKIHSRNYIVDTSFIANSDNFFLGGSNTFYKTSSSSDTTFSGFINEFALISGYISTDIVKSIGSGMIGEYFFSSGSPTIKQQITGYSESIIYKTGITGYDFNQTGTLTITTGRSMQTGSFASDSTSSVEEGDKYFKYYTLDNGDAKTFYKEEIGFLNPTSGFNYAPTGSGAFATLGLNDISASINTFTETTGIEGAGNVTIPLYKSLIQTGTLNEISGITTTALTETISVPAIPISGIVLSGDSETLKKDYIYYMRQRI